MPLLAIATGLIIGAIFIILTSESVYEGFKSSFFEGIAAMGIVVWKTYSSLFTGALGNPVTTIQAIASGSPKAIRIEFAPIFESLVASTPYIFSGLALALGFRAGVLNIGAEGQVFIGATFAAYVGYSVKGVPALIHLPLALLAGALGGAIWGFIPGWLKAKTGAHEVINCIMMNYIAFRLTDYLLTGPMKRPGSYNPVSPTIQLSAYLPRFFRHPFDFTLVSSSPWRWQP